VSNHTDRSRTKHATALIAGREIKERLRSKSYYFLTGLYVLLILAAGAIYRLAGDGGAEAIKVGVTESVPTQFSATITPVAELFGREVATVPISDAQQAHQALDDGDIDVAVLGDERQAVFADDIDAEVETIVQQAWSSAAIQATLIGAGLSTAQVDEVLSPDPLETVSLDGDSGVAGVAVLTGTMAAVLLFISLQTFGGYVLVGVVEEKSTAVVELLLARARADQLLAGKVIGIGVAALLQFTLMIVFGLAALLIAGTDVPGEVWSALPVTLVWFLGGYALYSTLFALAGSLVARQEDAQAAAAPVLAVLLLSYLLVFVFGYLPESRASMILSTVPLIAPLLMPMRMAAGAPSVVEVVIAMTLLLATIMVVWKLAGKIYEQVLLRRGSRIAWRDALSLLRPASRS
jgi:ABC-2 type transport system permease protein